MAIHDRHQEGLPVKTRSMHQLAAACCLAACFVAVPTVPVGATAPTGTEHAARGTGYLRLGQPVPDVELTTLSGNTGAFLSYFIGKGGRPLIINAWASWCGPCQEETPGLVRLYKSYRRRVSFVGVNLTNMDSRRKALAFVRRYHIPYPVLLDPKGAFRFGYAVIAEPMTYVVSRSGKLLAVFMGAMDEQRMQQMIHIAESERPVKNPL